MYGHVTRDSQASGWSGTDNQDTAKGKGKASLAKGRAKVKGKTHGETGKNGIHEMEGHDHGITESQTSQ